MIRMTVRELKKLRGKCYIQTERGWVRVVKKDFFKSLQDSYGSYKLFDVSLDTENEEILFLGVTND